MIFIKILLLSFISPAAAKLANATRIDRNRSLMNERSTSRKRHRRRNRRRHEQSKIFNKKKIFTKRTTTLPFLFIQP